MLPQELRDLMDSDSVFVQGTGLFDLNKDMAIALDTAAGYLHSAEYMRRSNENWDTELIQDRLRLADRFTRSLANQFQGSLGTRVSLSQCLGLARSLVEQEYDRMGTELFD